MLTGAILMPCACVCACACACACIKHTYTYIFKRKKHEETVKMVHRRLSAIQKVAAVAMGEELKAALPPLRKEPPKIVAL